MAKCNFSGSIENLSEGSLEFINKIIVGQDVKAKKVTFEPVGEAGDNLGANVKRIIVEGDDKSLQLIAKIAPQNEGIRQLWTIRASFLNEHIMYTEFFPKLKQMQIEAGVPETYRYRYAKCYGSLPENLQETLVLEDLKLSEFTMLDKLVSLNDTCVKSVLKNLAILHSFSFVLKAKEPAVFDDFKSKLTDVRRLMCEKCPPEIHVGPVVASITFLLDNEKWINKIKILLTNLAFELTSLSEFEYNNKSSVILQGDAWTNNFMFRFKDAQLTESIMIDYQASANGNPVNDVMSLIFNCTDYETRSKHYFDWIDYYHTELDTALSYYNLKANLFYPRSEMDADMKRYAKLIFGLSCVSCILSLRSGDEAVEMVDVIQNANDYAGLFKTIMTDKLKDKTQAILKEKITGFIKSFETYGIFED